MVRKFISQFTLLVGSFLSINQTSTTVVVVALEQDQKTTSSIDNYFVRQKPRVLYETFLPTGDIDDAQCNIEDLERANDSQLHAIFHELQETNFFRHFVVDLEHKCPLSNWRTKSSSHGEDKNDDNADSSSSSSSSETTPFMKQGNDAGQDEDEEEGEEFDCPSATSDELDPDAEPLCTVMTGDEDDDHGGLGFGTGLPFDSTVLQSLSEQGFSSQPQRETFEWNQQTDMIVQGDEEPCGEESADSYLPDTFWMDVCSNIQAGDGTKPVNLALNPERNTGYNGTHIWKAIYEENCMTTSDSCLEERVLYRLLSGLHTSTTLSIAKNYYPPSKRKGRISWEANPQYFMDKFQHHSEYIRNMHFAYVVLLRAIKKASSFLYQYEIQSGNAVDDKAAEVLLKRLLDTSILRSCSSVFSAFDESVMFREQDISLQQNFKGVFHNISSILDCVQCQQCKLHGKMGMLGYGTALKILFIKPEHLTLERNEIVALVNTAARLSESMVEVRELTTMFWESQQKKIGTTTSSTSSTTTSHDSSPTTTTAPENTPTPAPSLHQAPVQSMDIVDVTVGAIAMLGREGMVSMEREQDLVRLALSKHPELLVLGKHYGNDAQRFLAMLGSIGDNGDNLSKTEPLPDAIVVGSGLAGLAASLNILDRGGTVVILEKEHLLGGNSNKASSGINGCCPQNDTYNDSLESFMNDTIKSAGPVADLDLIDTLVSNSEKAVTWLQQRANVDLSLLAQLGGHSHKRTHRPSNGMAGAEIIYQMQKAVRAFAKTGKAKIIIDTKVTQLLTDKTQDDEEEDRVVGVMTESTIDGTVTEYFADNVILATGGFASDRTNGSYLDQNRPELMSFPATAGGFSTGDGITLATALGAGTRDMDKIQIHPTGWIDPTDPKNPTKILAAELMRGVGGILLSKTSGKRFCNELGTRAYVTDKMLQHDPTYASTGKWDSNNLNVPEFFLVLSSSAALDGKKHVDLYTHKGLLTKVSGLDELAKHMNVPKKALQQTMEEYQHAAKKGIDEFGKTSFRGLPANNLSKEVFYVGTVTPVLHYCMGGITIDTYGNVLRQVDGTIIKGLHAAGEVTGGVHGNNRLGGNSLLECTVFGTIVGQKIPIKEEKQKQTALADNTSKQNAEEQKKKNKMKEITVSELAKHNTENDIWVAINDIVYDFTEFATEHPAGFQSIYDLAGTDGTDAFLAVHNLAMLDDFDEEQVGILST